MKKKKQLGLTRLDASTQMIEEIIEQLRIQNKIHAIAVEALLDKKIESEKHEKPK